MEMVNRIASFMTGGDAQAYKPAFWRRALETIREMREPTETMVAAGVRAANVSSSQVVAIWQAMIDQAQRGIPEVKKF